jgi:cytidylate kinase
LVIAIDGPAGSGKSTTARLVAKALGYLHVDTGAMYRAITLKILRRGIRPDDDRAIGGILDGTRVELQKTAEGLQVLLDGLDVSKEIRTPEVSRAVSSVSSIKEVRAVMVREQRSMGAGGGIVLEGRDIGTVVFPDADLKIFLVAKPEERARRRLEELRLQGVTSELQTILQEMRERDRLDSTRAESPLRQAEDAVEIDTTGLTVEEQVQRIVELARNVEGSRRS